MTLPRARSKAVTMDFMPLPGALCMLSKLCDATITCRGCLTIFALMRTRTRALLESPKYSA